MRRKRVGQFIVSILLALLALWALGIGVIHLRRKRRSAGLIR